MDELVVSLKRAAQKRRLVLENRQLRALHAEPEDTGSLLLGDSPIIVHLRQTLAQIADAEIDVLITGETGAGKETAARALHRMSNRRGKPFAHINCASLPEDTYHVDLFGAEPGPRSGAFAPSRRIVGRLERAHRGVVLLDDVDALSLAQQAKLLSVVEGRQIWPLGAEEPRPLDVRIIATTRLDLQAAVAADAFRADLFYRLSGVSIHIPSLAQRRSDIRLLFQHFVVRSCARLRRPIPRLTEPVHAHLQAHAWPGNVRELEHFAERFALGLEDARLPNASAEEPEPGLAGRVARFEADVIRETLAVFKGDARASARALRLPRKTFYDKLARHGIRIGLYRS
jgi:two-component system C4-dicarboxylate transport response regulator DctD